MSLSLSPEAERDFSDACRRSDIERVALYETNLKQDEQLLRTGLWMAAKNGLPELTRYFLSQGARWDRSILASAARSDKIGRLGVFQALREYGWDVNESGRDGETMLSYVVDDVHVVRWFLEQGADPNIGPRLHFRRQRTRPIRPVPDSGRTLDMIAQCGTLEVLELMLEYGLRLNSGSALHLAAKTRVWPDADQIPMLARLIDLGFDVNGHDPDPLARPPYLCDTPLNCTIQYGHVKRFEYLLQRGATLDLWRLETLRRVARTGVLVHSGSPELVEAIDRHVASMSTSDQSS
ncbi:uncharacterized protein N7459_002999 [Penicillium hispanicum]|uniref:uncharacterized protein n=1 Tax=Penicillium hispanicum TaxID=1080232 RepID=UPI0025409F73|nr:uncharacterized protein N7459_002999 [Penicillium hispanicum]KAJ5587234.1 hypothetical protein N7459_002999 [Penicillium hispanicum]